VSTDRGVHWNKTSAPLKQWNSLSSSADGSKLAASASGVVYISTSGGKLWTTSSRALSYAGQQVSLIAVAYSGDGAKLVAAASSGIYMYNGTAGGWWRTSAPSQPWVSIAASADGSKLVAAMRGASMPSSVYVSLNGGTTWLQSSAPSSGSVSWGAVVSSGDGKKLAAVAGSKIYIGTLVGPPSVPPIVIPIIIPPSSRKSCYLYLNTHILVFK
jgi:hypothetical protein